jgi:hypothetical protein
VRRNSIKQHIEHSSIYTKHSFECYFIQQVHLIYSISPTAVSITKKKNNIVGVNYNVTRYDDGMQHQTKLTSYDTDEVCCDTPFVINSTSPLYVSTSVTDYCTR